MSQIRAVPSSLAVRSRRPSSAPTSAPEAPTPGATGQRWNRLDVVAPEEVATPVGDAVVAARAMAKQWLTTGKAKKRDRFLCQIPGCSLPADDEHDLQFRSQGGSDLRPR